MNARSGLEDLQSQIDSQILVLDETASFLATMLSDEIRDQKNRKNGLVVAGLLENYYTAAETVLFRVVQEFGSNLDFLTKKLRELHPVLIHELRAFKQFLIALSSTDES